MRSDERGQAAPLVLVAILFTALSCLGLARLGAASAVAARSQAAADAAALAGAAGGEPAARRLAAANDAMLVEYRTVGADVEVTVERGGDTATARARWVPAPIT
jgi:hypothetical protein